MEADVGEFFPVVGDVPPRMRDKRYQIPKLQLPEKLLAERLGFAYGFIQSARAQPVAREIIGQSLDCHQGILQGYRQLPIIVRRIDLSHDAFLCVRNTPK